MKTIIITTQAELDALPEKFSEWTEIQIKCGSRIEINKVRGNSQVTARGNSQVTAWENSQVTAYNNVCIHNFSKSTCLTVSSLVVIFLIEVTKNLKKTKTNTIIIPKTKPGVNGWLETQGTQNTVNVVLYKRVNKDFKTQEDTSNETLWKIGKTIVHENYNPKNEEYGEGKFHACSQPYFCDEFRDIKDDKYIAIEIAKKDLYAWPNPVYPHKIAFRAGKVLYQCDKFGKKV